MFLVIPLVCVDDTNDKGTVLVLQDSRLGSDAKISGHPSTLGSLKMTKDGIILNPQPVDDPNDPLV